MRMIGRKRPEGTAIPNVISPKIQYSMKKIASDEILNLEGVFTEKILRTASSLVVRRRVARSL